MDVQTWHLRASKLAIALAIIRSKPADKSSREYTEHLATLVSEQDSNCRSKVEALEAEVLQLRQEVFLSKICSRLFKSGNLTSQEHKSSENTLTLMEDSGYDLSSEGETELSELSQRFVENHSAPPFPPLPLVKKAQATPESPLSSHMKFLQHLLSLKNLTESGSLVLTDITYSEKDSSTVSDSVSRMLDGLITFYRDPKLPFSKFWTEAVDTLARLINDCNFSNHILKTCSKKLEEFENTLLQVLIGRSHINRFQEQHYVSHTLVTLGSCSLLRKSVISLLLSEINCFVDDLRAIDQVQASYDVTRYENVFSLLWVLEQLLQKENREECTSSTGHGDQEIKKYLQKHEEAIFQLSDTFPLLTFYLWRLGILLSSAETETVDNASLS
ncbi:PREDICTED: meiosis-specific protein MEI4-like [Chinchilla lanigera]|uniref:Meiotic double-stranded break formation protein 4 n=1 Tax=Chinchilla lanigera TaxID=34839 RepID=A0A8C2UTK8_CHILA|nr:PREDICTED: meiosis-specific protein MEI4-like [Chinchilla lanigera]